MKNAPTVGASARDTDGAKVRPVSVAPCTFTIIRFTRCNFGSLQAQLTIAVDGVAKIDVDYFRPVDRSAFVVAASTRSKLTGKWERRTRLDEHLAAEILAAVEARIAAESDGE